MILAAGLWDDLEFWSAVGFVIFACVIGFGFVPGIRQALRQRESQIVEQLEQAERTKIEIGRLLDERETRKARAREEAAEIVAEAKRDAERTEKEWIAAGDAEAQNLRSRSEREMGQIRFAARFELFRFATDRSVRVAERALADRLSEDDQRRLIDEAIEEIGQFLGESA